LGFKFRALCCATWATPPAIHSYHLLLHQPHPGFLFLEDGDCLFSLCFLPGAQSLGSLLPDGSMHRAQCGLSLLKLCDEWPWSQLLKEWFWIDNDKENGIRGQTGLNCWRLDIGRINLHPGTKYLI
jgi:hypothetical protein